MSQISEIDKLTDRINEIKKEIQGLGELRPGSLTQQYSDPKNKTGEYYQISYTHKMRSKTDYVKKKYFIEMENQVREYKKLKALFEEWTELGIKKSKLKMKADL